MYICDAVTVKGPSRKPFPKFIPRVLWRKGTHWQEPIVTDNFLTVALSVQALCCIKARGGGGGRCHQGNLWYSPPASMTLRLASVTFKMASKVVIEEMDKNFDFTTEILFRFLGFGDFEVSIVIEN